MIIHNNHVGFTVYKCHLLSHYNALYAEYLHNEEAMQFYSPTLQKIVHSAGNIFIANDLYKRNYITVEVTDIGDYSVAVKIPPNKYDRPWTMGIVIENGNMVMITRQLIIHDDIAILYFDEHVENIPNTVELCYITRKKHV